jgi:catechol 2,3-dioxygenase-like lactoylglutathione lyase family enzyme
LTVRRVVVDHVVLLVRDLEESERFYSSALEPLGFGLLSRKGDCVSYGVDDLDDFAICRSPEPTNRAHVAFVAGSREAVQGFYERALAAGGRRRIRPGIREEYGPTYYAAFVYDPEGNNIEAVYHEGE